MEFHKYPEIVLLGRRPEIFAVKQVVATEKLHGSSFRIGFPAGMVSTGEILFGSRELEYKPGESFPLGASVQYFKNHPNVLTSMWETLKSYGFSDVIIFGEAYGPGIKAKGVKYSNGTEVLFRAFDIMVAENFLTYDLFCEVVDKMGLPRVHEVWRGEPSREAFDALLGKVSVEGQRNGITDEKNLAEGVVIRSNPLFRNVFGEWLIFKHKNEHFSEVASAPKVKRTEATPAEIFAATYVTEGRLLNAIGRLEDRGVVLKKTMVDMPTLIQEIEKDLIKECSEVMTMAPGVVKQLTGAISKIVAPLYRKHLGI